MEIHTGKHLFIPGNISSFRKKLIHCEKYTRRGGIMQSKSDFLKKTWVLTVLALFCCLLWGSAFPAVKIGYRLFSVDSADSAAQLLFAGIRFALAGVMTIVFGSLIEHRFLIPARTSWPKICLLSLFQTSLQYCFFYISLAHTTGVKGSIIDSTHVFFSLIFASLIFRQEKFTAGKISGCILGFIGVILANLNGSGMTAGFSLQGEGFMFIAAASCGFAAVLISRYSRMESPFTLTGYQFFIGGLVLMAVGFCAGGRLKPLNVNAVLILLFLAFIAAAAYSVWNILLKHNPVSKVTIFGFSITCFAVLLSYFFLHEELGMPVIRLIASIVLVSAGVILVNLNPAKKNDCNKK